MKNSRIEKLIKKLCPDGVEYRELRDLVGYEQPSKYIVKDSEYSDEYKTPVLTAGQTFILGYTNEDENIFKADENNPVIIFDDFTTSFHWVDFAFKVKSSAMKILLPKNENADFRYVYYAMECINFMPQIHARHWISKYSKFKIPLPPLDIQKEIVKILNEFTELEAELEAELEKRKKQYEYYINKMFNFGDEVRWEKMDDVASSKLMYGSGASAIDYDGEVRYIRITDINEDGGLNSEIKSPSKVDEQYLLNDGDILFARSGATVGKTFRYRSCYGKSIYAGYLIRFVADLTKVLPDFIYYFTKSSNYIDFVEKNKSTGSQPNINAKQYGSIKIPIPPLSEQKRIVSILDKFDSLVNDISIGLPAELNARRKQYEYYRNKLLTFKEYGK